MAFIQFRRAIDVTKNPREFFSEVKNERGNSAAFRFLFIMLLIPSAFVAIVWASGRIITHPFTFQIPVLTAASFFSFIAVMFVIVLIESAVMHIIARAIGGKGEFSSTMKAVIYGGGIFYITSAFPFITLLGLYSVYLTSVGIATLHKIPMRKVLAIVIVLTIASLAAEFAFMGPEAVFGSFSLDRLGLI